MVAAAAVIKVASFIAKGKPTYGLIAAGGVIDLAARYATQWPDLQAVIANGALLRLADAGVSLDTDYSLDEIDFTIPVATPEKILCVGVNYPDRNEEYSDGQPAPANPSLFVRFPRSFIGHRQHLVRPLESTQLDYEGEVVIVIGKAGRRIPEASALDHIAALTLCNEGTVRDWTRHAKFNVTQGKNFDRSGAMGPWLVPYEGERQIADIELLTRVNGFVRQRDRTSRMMFSFRRIIAYVSAFTTLVPGDIIATGTPAGAGGRLAPPVWLQPGDIVEVSADGIGTLVNGVVDEGHRDADG